VEHAKSPAAQGRGLIVRPIYINIIFALIAIAGVGFGAYEYGQLHSGTSTTQAAETTAPQAAAAPASAQKPAPDRTWFTKATEGNWKLRCRAQPEPVDMSKSCIGLIDVVNTKTKQLVLAWMIGTNKTGGLSMTFQTPTGVIVASGLGLVLDSGETHRYPFAACGSQACQATTAMDDALIAELQKAAQAHVLLTLASGQGISINMPVNGADKILADLTPAKTP
jgi:invasion protein IalB